MADHVGIDVDGLDEFITFLGGAHGEIGREVRDLLDDLAKRGEYYIRLYAPAYSSELLRRIGRHGPRPAVGARGPEWEAVTGVVAGDRYPLYVHGGTGIYKSGIMGGARSPLPVPGGTLIRSRTPGKPMTFQKRGEPRKFRMSARGQRSNPFVLYAFQQLVPYARGRMRRMFRRD
jgi:hypothetical protein